MPISNGLRKLEERLAQLNDPSERQEIVACVAAQIQIAWNELFELIANQQNPERALQLLAELADVVEDGKAQLAGKGCDSPMVHAASAGASGRFGRSLQAVTPR